MILEGYYLSSKKWIPVQVSNINDFLEEHKLKLRSELVRRGIAQLNQLQLYPYEIVLGECKIIIVGTGEAMKAIPSLEYALDNYC